MSFSCFMELYTRYPFISRHLRFGWLYFTSFLKAAQSWLKTVHFMWRKTVQFYWLKSVHFILPLTSGPQPQQDSREYGNFPSNSNCSTTASSGSGAKLADSRVSIGYRFGSEA